MSRDPLEIIRVVRRSLFDLQLSSLRADSSIQIDERLPDLQKKISEACGLAGIDGGDFSLVRLGVRPSSDESDGESKMTPRLSQWYDTNLSILSSLRTALREAGRKSRERRRSAAFVRIAEETQKDASDVDSPSASASVRSSSDLPPVQFVASRDEVAAAVAHLPEDEDGDASTPKYSTIAEEIAATTNIDLDEVLVAIGGSSVPVPVPVPSHSHSRSRLHSVSTASRVIKPSDRSRAALSRLAPLRPSNARVRELQHHLKVQFLSYLDLVCQLHLRRRGLESEGGAVAVAVAGEEENKSSQIAELCAYYEDEIEALERRKDAVANCLISDDPGSGSLGEIERVEERERKKRRSRSIQHSKEFRSPQRRRRSKDDELQNMYDRLTWTLTKKKQQSRSKSRSQHEVSSSEHESDSSDDDILIESGQQDFSKETDDDIDVSEVLGEARWEEFMQQEAAEAKAEAEAEAVPSASQLHPEPHPVKQEDLMDYDEKRNYYRHNEMQRLMQLLNSDDSKKQLNEMMKKNLPESPKKPEHSSSRPLPPPSPPSPPPRPRDDHSPTPHRQSPPPSSRPAFDMDALPSRQPEKPLDFGGTPKKTTSGGSHARLSSRPSTSRGKAARVREENVPFKDVADRVTTQAELETSVKLSESVDRVIASLQEGQNRIGGGFGDDFDENKSVVVDFTAIHAAAFGGKDSDQVAVPSGKAVDLSLMNRRVDAEYEMLSGVPRTEMEDDAAKRVAPPERPQRKSRRRSPPVVEETPPPARPKPDITEARRRAAVRARTRLKEQQEAERRAAEEERRRLEEVERVKAEQKRKIQQHIRGELVRGDVVGLLHSILGNESDQDDVDEVERLAGVAERQRVLDAQRKAALRVRRGKRKFEMLQQRDAEEKRRRERETFQKRDARIQAFIQRQKLKKIEEEQQQQTQKTRRPKKKKRRPARPQQPEESVEPREAPAQMALPSILVDRDERREDMKKKSVRFAEDPEATPKPRAFLPEPIAQAQEPIEPVDPIVGDEPDFRVPEDELFGPDDEALGGLDALVSPGKQEDYFGNYFQ